MAALIYIYETDFGTVRLPDDFPSYAIRKNGLPDLRRREANELQRYIENLKKQSRAAWNAGRPVRDMRARSWAGWLKRKKAA